MYWHPHYFETSRCYVEWSGSYQQLEYVTAFGGITSRIISRQGQELAIPKPATFVPPNEGTETNIARPQCEGAGYESSEPSGRTPTNVIGKRGWYINALAAYGIDPCLGVGGWAYQKAATKIVNPPKLVAKLSVNWHRGPVECGSPSSFERAVRGLHSEQ